jgi:hypothetical protein
MSLIAYKSWGLIPVDPEPTEGECNSLNPPMMSNLALDGGASLFFLFGQSHAALQVGIETTALSAEGVTPEIFSFYTGSQSDNFHRLSPTQAEKGYEGEFAVFTLSVSNCDLFFKVHNQSTRMMIINKIAFS